MGRCIAPFRRPATTASKFQDGRSYHGQTGLPQLIEQLRYSQQQPNGSDLRHHRFPPCYGIHEVKAAAPIFVTATSSTLTHLVSIIRILAVTIADLKRTVTNRRTRDRLKQQDIERPKRHLVPVVDRLLIGDKICGLCRSRSSLCSLFFFVLFAVRFLSAFNTLAFSPQFSASPRLRVKLLSPVHLATNHKRYFDESIAPRAHRRYPGCKWDCPQLIRHHPDHIWPH